MSGLQKSFDENDKGEVLRVCQDQIKAHNFGSLVFLSVIGPYPWFGVGGGDLGYRGVYTSDDENCHQIFIEKNIVLVSLERFVYEIINGNNQTHLFLDSPTVYSSKEFLAFKTWVGQHPSRAIYGESFLSVVPQDKMHYLKVFLEIGNVLAILGGQKTSSDLLKLNKAVLHLPLIDRELKIIRNDDQNKWVFPPEEQKKYQKALEELRARLKGLYKITSLPSLNVKDLSSLEIIKKKASRLETMLGCKLG